MDDVETQIVLDGFCDHVFVNKEFIFQGLYKGLDMLEAHLCNDV
jgi:hypothetical protein